MTNKWPLLQLALDTPSEEAAFNTARLVNDHVDWIEAGTPLIIKAGLGVVRKLHDEFPAHPIVADVKIMDTGSLIATMAYDAGADMITVMSAAPKSVLDDALEVARARGKKVMLDLLGSKLTEASLENYCKYGVHVVIVHHSHEVSEGVVASIGIDVGLLKNYQIPFAVAGRLNIETIPTIVNLEPMTIIVGSAITKAEDPVLAAFSIRRVLHGHIIP